MRNDDAVSFLTHIEDVYVARVGHELHPAFVPNAVVA
jgi:hypothetical protein